MREPTPPPPILTADPVRPRKDDPLAKHSLLAAAFQRQIKPNWRSYIHYAELAARNGDSAMTRYIDSYKALNSLDKLCWWPEQICEYANVSPGDLMGAVCKCIWEASAAECGMILSMANPQVLRSTIAFAKKEENVKDREMFFRMVGQLPDRKGASINIYNQAAGELPPSEVTAHGRLKTFDAEVIDMSRDLEEDGKTLAEVFRVPSENRPEDD